MARNLDIMEEQIELGDVKTITANGGLNVKFVELLFSATTKAQFAPSKDKKYLEFTVSSNQMGIPELDAKLNKATLYDFIVSLKKIYSELEESEVTE